MLGTELNVVVFLEWILVVYSMALVFNSDKKAFKIMHIVLGIMWAVLALLNMFA